MPPASIRQEPSSYQVSEVKSESDNSLKGRLTDPKRATRFVVLLGIVSLFADMTYESARSITGPFLALLGASATVVGITAGLGELIGYALRFVSGRIADRTGRYWAVTIFGYCLNLLAVPALALAGNWQLAVFLMFLERIGKAMRNPPRDAMLSFAASRMGRGWSFALHEAMDQTGATVGPLVVAAVLYLRNDYRLSFAVLLIPALLSLAVLMAARARYPHPRVTLSRRPRTWIPTGTRDPSGSTWQRRPVSQPASPIIRSLPITSGKPAPSRRSGFRFCTPLPWGWTAWRRLRWAVSTTAWGWPLSSVRQQSLCRSRPLSSWAGSGPVLRARSCGASAWGHRSRS